MESMQQRLSVTGYSLSELAHAYPRRLPPLVGPNHPVFTDAPLQLPVFAEDQFSSIKNALT